MPRTNAFRANILIGFDQEILARIETERGLAAPVPPRTEMIRQLISEALDARFMERLRKPAKD